MALAQNFGGGAYAASFDCGDYLGFLEKTVTAKLVGRDHSFRYIETESSDRKRGNFYRFYVVAEFGFSTVGGGCLLHWTRA
jgi:hypothetical protein